jgi:hypothetical protein
MGYVLIDANGVIAASGANTAVAGRHAFSAVIPEGRYTLRVAGIDDLRRSGLVERPFVAATTSTAGLRVSSLILAPVPAANDALQPIVFRTSEDRVTAYVEWLAGEGAGLPAADVRFEILRENATTPLVAQAASGRAGGALTVARADLNLAGLPGGSYQARAVISMDGKPVGQVVRPFYYAPR